MNFITTTELNGISSYENYANGQMRECRLNKYNLIHTRLGDFVPQYKRPGVRRKDGASICFYPSGNIRSISLDEQVEVETKVGIFPAELVTFYEDGSIDSIFPLNGQMSFAWALEDEEKLCESYEFTLSFASFNAKIIGLRFFQKGSLKSLILWPGEKVLLNTPIGKIETKTGFRLYENGQIYSLEPAAPVSVQTPVGCIEAFDESALEMDADNNSLRFAEDGKLLSLKTTGIIIIYNKADETKTFIMPDVRIGLEDDNYHMMPFTIEFRNNRVEIYKKNKMYSYVCDQHRFEFKYNRNYGTQYCIGDCSKCSGPCE